MNSECVKLQCEQCNERTNDRDFISLALRLEAATEREDDSECDVIWNIEKSSLISKSKQIHDQNYKMYENIYSCKKWLIHVREIFTNNAKQQKHEKESCKTR